MIIFAILVLVLGVLLIARPEIWWRLNAPEGQKGHVPTDAYVRATRVRGIVFAVGGAVLLVLQIVRTRGM